LDSGVQFVAESGQARIGDDLHSSPRWSKEESNANYGARNIGAQIAVFCPGILQRASRFTPAFNPRGKGTLGIEGYGAIYVGSK
jgi:hypothetical protein